MVILHFIFFAIISTIAILSAIGAVFTTRIMYNLLSLTVLFFAVGGIFFLLNADFIGVVQIMIYGIGITILMVFAIMLTSDNLDKALWIAFAPRTLVSFLTVSVLFTGLTLGITNNLKDFKGSDFFKTQSYKAETIKDLKENGTSKRIGELLLTKYAVPFELLSLILLAAIVGAGVIASKPNESEA